MIPYTLKMRNFLSYVQEEIDFSELESIVLINGINSEASTDADGNGAGKSGILDAIEWALYGRVRGILQRELVKDDIIHISENGSRAKMVRIEFTFQMDDGYYIVIREKALNGPTVLEIRHSTDMKMWKNLTLSSGVNKRSNKKETSIKRTQQKINDILNANCDLFINSVFFEQMNTNTFALSAGADKSNLLRQALYLDKWMDYAQLQKVKLQAVEKEIGAVEYQLNRDKPGDIRKKIESIGRALDECTSKKHRMVTTVDELHVKYRESSKKLAEVEAMMKVQASAKSQLIDIRTSVKDCRKRINDLTSRIDIINGSMHTSIHSIIEIKEDISNVTKYRDDSKKHWDTLSVDENDYSSDIDAVKNKISTLQGEAKGINNQKDTFTSDCPLNASNCSRGSEEAHKDKIKKINNAVFKINRVISKHKKDLIVVEEKIKKQYDEKVEKSKAHLAYTGFDGTLRSLMADLKNKEERQDTFQADIDSFYDPLVDEEERFITLTAKLKEKEKDCELFASVDVNTQRRVVAKAEENLKYKQHRLTEISNDQVRLEQSVDNNQLKLKELADNEELFNDLNDRRRVLKYSVKILSKEIPHQLIEGALPEIEAYAQEYITELSGGRMNISIKTQMDIQKKDKATREAIQKDELYMELETDGVAKKYALCSGGEKTRADIAIHFAYATFMFNRSGAKIRSLYLDEVGMALDETGRNALVSLLNYLISEVGFKKIFIISQDEKFNKMFSCILTVKKTSLGSKVCLN